ncbi:Protein CBR-UBXN-6 [Caenorhabditis briggsae]|uniref:Protein CBR-UBXN-6 n=1 Tax=Caenorhabditis briggsae TaxID=6238 RepID=A8XDQ5_CAEBR|nr:Protein CBR-UBXN-6 [Caenorhabditis briggsae]CAP30775.2 Protein CBR-UBXN-6 [Caenorhabditis briggsae]
MGEPLVVAEPTTTEQTPLSSTNSVAYQNSDSISTPSEPQFSVESIYRALIIFCDTYSLDKKQVALGLFLTFLLIVFSIGTVVAWNRYSPIIQEFIIKEKRRMNKFKKFFAKKRTENHFKHSGEGQKLSESSGASSSTSRVVDRDVQAEAALRRLQKTEPPQDASKKRIQMMAKKQLEDERRQMEELKITEASRPPEPQELDHSQVISNILYYSELLGEEHARTKSELLEDIKTFLLEQVAEAEDESDKVIAAVLMLYSLNQREVKEKAIETICKLCQNILEHPGEEKYKTIRLTNEAILTRVINPVGGRAFLEAVGFMERTNSEGVPQMVFDRETDFHLIEALEALRNGQAVPIKVSRNLEVFKLKLGQEVKAPKVPDAFYNLSAAEIKAEQKNKSKEVESVCSINSNFPDANSPYQRNAPTRREIQQQQVQIHSDPCQIARQSCCSALKTHKNRKIKISRASSTSSNPSRRSENSLQACSPTPSPLLNFVSTTVSSSTSTMNLSRWWSLDWCHLPTFISHFWTISMNLLKSWLQIIWNVFTTWRTRKLIFCFVFKFDFSPLIYSFFLGDLCSSSPILLFFGWLF